VAGLLGRRRSDALKGALSNHVVPVRKVQLAGGAELLVVICGDITTDDGMTVLGRGFRPLHPGS
jgi:formyltetrahydrofolate synthetase